VRPSEEGAVLLHRKHGSAEKIVLHCTTVARVSRLLAEEFRKKGREVDIEAVVVGALLHDIGRSRTQTVRHGLEGSSIVEEEGLDKTVVEIVLRHVGAGIDSEEARKLGLPELDYIPHTLEERIVCFADKMVDGEKVRPFDEEVKRFTQKSHDVMRLLALKRRLEEELGEDPEAFVLNNIKASG